MRSPTLALPVAIGALALAACQPSVEERAAAAKDVIDRYCTDCHNEAERTADLTLERMALTDVGAHAEVWETVVKKLRGRMMPPAGEPLPNEQATTELVAYLEDQLDAAAAANPNPGRKSLHRLNRTEYGNAIRDLLALEINANAFLPNDSEAYGFDNIADVLGTDPSLMDRYLSRPRGKSRAPRWATPISRRPSAPIACRPTARKPITSKGCRSARAAACS